ncbi:MAG: hypothetical protein IJ156_09795 [Bacteroidales bacterium]|nr:hypothetical protein [Bacteroidales bacterium]
MNKTLKIVIEILLALAAVGCVYGIYSSIMKPVNFNKEKARRQEVAVQRLKDIRTLQVAFKGVNNRFTDSIDSLKMFYNEGKMDIIMQVGSNDDSLAVVNTNKYKNDKAFKKLSKAEQNAKFMELYRKGEKLVFSISTPIAVKDTLFNNRPDFCIDSLKYIPFSGKQPVEMEAIVKTVSGVQVPLFEARMPWKALLKGMDNQLRINLDAECRDQNRYEGLQVGSVTNPNNNAGNWE